MDLHLGNLSRLSPAASRSISAENPGGDAGEGGRAVTGTGKAASRDLGRGWKVSPAVAIEPAESKLLAAIDGPGQIQHLWMGVNGDPRLAILRIAWDGSTEPSVQCPVGHYFACGWGGVERFSSLAVCMNPRNGLNCWWPMPFRSSCRLTVENMTAEPLVVYYQIDYTLGDVPADAGRFHARFRRSDPLGKSPAHSILDGVRGRGQYVGTYLAVQPGTGDATDVAMLDSRIAFLIDGDREGGEVRRSTLAAYVGSTGGFAEFSNPYAGLASATGPEGNPAPHPQYGLYRWHVMDPIRFAEGLRVIVEPGDPSECGAPPAGELASVAYWYQQA